MKNVSINVATTVPEHSGEQGDAAHSLTLLGGLELELQLRQDGQQHAGTDVVQLVDQVVHLLRDAQLGVRLAQNQHLKSENMCDKWRTAAGPQSINQSRSPRKNLYRFFYTCDCSSH